MSDNKLPDRPCEVFAEPPPGCTWHTWFNDTCIHVQTVDAEGRIVTLFRALLDGIHACDACGQNDIPADYRLTQTDGATAMVTETYFCRHHTLLHPDFGIEDYFGENKWEAIRFLPRSGVHR